MGSAVYLTASLFNHSCEPSVDVTWPRNDATARFTAARDVAAGEALTVCYTDAAASLAARRRHLRESYGFVCRCALCAEQEEEEQQQQQAAAAAAARGAKTGSGVDGGGGGKQAGASPPE